ncbi:multidrug resistance efflux pump [Burkholderiales bacterium JOSHI_001]|nr:multidrug resistance efflux pump [Burkholderiales bacterium JOSHI_001]
MGAPDLREPAMNTHAPNPGPAAPAAAATGPAKRRRALLLIATAVLLGGAAYGAYWALVLNHVEHTDNAYVQGHVVQITPQVAGTVLAIQADETDFVKAGQVLVKLDPADARVALQQAEAQLAQTVREVRTLYVNNATLGAQASVRQAEAQRAQAEVARMQSEVKRALDDVTRRAPLVASGAVGREEFEHANAQLASARSALGAAQSALAATQQGVSAAREQLASNQSMTEGTSVEQHPNVQRAAARVREAHLALQRNELLSPLQGHVAKRTVQLGQRVQAGAPLMTVVALDKLWVDANFKESQLKNLRIGQPATLRADVYGKQVAYHGSVAGLGAGTGAAFALLPAQNATGNWIKIVQRVPVRITLDAAELQAHPLRLGLSMNVEVDVTQQGGKTLADVPRTPSAATTAAATAAADTDDAAARTADADVHRIVAAHLGRGAAPALVPRAGAAAAH